MGCIFLWILVAVLLDFGESANSCDEAFIQSVPRSITLPGFGQECPSKNHTIWLGLFQNTNDRCRRLNLMSSVSDDTQTMLGGALVKAVRDINGNCSLLSGYELRVKYVDTQGYDKRSAQALVQFVTNQSISALFALPTECHLNGVMANAFNLPIMASKCMDLGRRRTYPTMIQTSPSSNQIINVTVAFFKRFHWNVTTMVYLHASRQLAENMKKVLEKNDDFNVSVSSMHEINRTTLFFRTLLLSELEKVIEATHRNTRIYLIVFGRENDATGFPGPFMKVLYKRGLLEKGEYFVVGVDTYFYMPGHRSFMYVKGAVKTTNRTKESEELVENSRPWFNSFMSIVPTVEAESSTLNKFFCNVDWVGRAAFLPTNNETSFFCSRDSSGTSNKHDACPYVIANWLLLTYLYDAVKLYAIGAERAIHRGMKPNDGLEIRKLLEHTSYVSAAGIAQNLDGNGDAEYDISSFRVLYISRNLSTFFRGCWSFLNNKLREKGGELLPHLALTEIARFGSDANKRTHVSDFVWPLGRPPRAVPLCGFENEWCQKENSRTNVTNITIIVCAVVLALLIIFIVACERVRRRKLDDNIWKVSIDHLRRFGTDGWEHNEMLPDILPDADKFSRDCPIDAPTKAVLHSNLIVMMKPTTLQYTDFNRKIRQELTQMKVKIKHANLVTFHGGCIEPNFCLLMEFNSKGSLQIVTDILAGLQYLHNSTLRCHGDLRSSNCEVDGRWSVKLGDFAFKSLRTTPSTPPPEELFWRAPELLRNRTPLPYGTPDGDIYSFGIILYELFGRIGPYDSQLQYMSSQEIIADITSSLDTPFRPHLSMLSTVPKFVTDLISDCWADMGDASHQVSFRPKPKDIQHRLKDLTGSKKSNILDNLMELMEKYSTNLENIIQEKTKELKAEKDNSEMLLRRMLPRQVAEQLKMGKSVEAQSFDCVTIYFSDIVQFTALSAASTPMQIVHMLNNLYTLFDGIIENYGVYKVETIGDAYMVVSGVPERQPDHADQIGQMSVEILQKIKEFQIPHRPSDKLKLRIGLHSGPCVAGVVGKAMPRYCLFGDTVNTASRMESNGEPLKIHCSPFFKERIVAVNDFHFLDRGIVNMKGKQPMYTYWLIGYRENYQMTNSLESLFHGGDQAAEDQPFLGLSVYRDNGSLNHRSVSTISCPNPSSLLQPESPLKKKSWHNMLAPSDKMKKQRDGLGVRIKRKLTGGSSSVPPVVEDNMLGSKHSASIALEVSLPLLEEPDEQSSSTLF